MAAEMKLGQPKTFESTIRYYKQNRSHSIRDVFDALVEIITNCDDSYHRLYIHQKKAMMEGPFKLK